MTIPILIANNDKLCEKWHLLSFIHYKNMTPEEVKTFIEAGLENAIAYVEGDGTHFTAAVICPQFAGKTRIQKQQLVYDTVRAQLLDGTLHALSLTTFTPEEWHALDLGSEKP